MYTPEKNAMILLLSSEPVVRAVIKEVLEGAGYVVLATGGLGTAAELLAEYPIDLLVTHPYIDNVPGHAAAKYLRTQKPGLAVLVIAGLLEDDRLQNRADLEGFDLFPAAFTAAQLLEKVAEVLEAARKRETAHAGQA
jgi:DNA-binding NtrC family response regulator